jgi:branched-chain amino acid transport system substrate-binding protein
MRQRSENNRLVRRNFVWKAIAICFLVALCGVPLTCIAAPPDQVNVGFVLPMTGGVAEWGRQGSQAVKLVFDEVNALGGIKSLGGAKLKMVVLDSQSSPEVAMSQTENLCRRDDIVLVSGCIQSAAAMVASQVAERNKVPFLAAVDATDELSERGFRYYFQNAPKMSYFGRELVKFYLWIGDKTGVKVKSAVGLCEDSPVGQAATKRAVKDAKEAGIQVLDYITYPWKSTKDFTPIISKIKAAGADVVMQLSYTPDSILLTRSMKELDYNPLAITGMLGGHYTREYIKTLGRDAEYTMDVVGFVPDLRIPGLEEIKKKYKENFGEEITDVGAKYFTGAAIIVDTLERAGATDREKVRDAMSKTDLKIGDKYVISLNGVKFDDTGSNIRAGFVMLQILDGEQKSVWPAEYAAAKPVWPAPKWNKR